VQLRVDLLDLDVLRNDSLGAHSAELLRRLNGRRAARENRSEQRAVKQLLAKQILVAHRELEPAITLPSQHLKWASKMSQKLVEEVRAVAPIVVGDLDELIVAPSAKKSAAQGGAPRPSEAELNELALDTILDLVGRVDPKSQHNKR
jgi:hypothetical protein